MEKSYKKYGYSCIRTGHAWDYHKRLGYLLPPFRHCIHCNILQQRRKGVFFFLFDTVGTWFNYTK